MLSEADLSLVRSLEQGQVTDCPFSTVTSAFYHHASLYPDAIAARDMSSSPAKELTYEDLAAQVQSLAVKLRDLGVGPGQRVPILVKRGLDMIVGIWAVLSCGAQYVPLDGGVVPETTIRTVVEQAGGLVVLCISSTVHRLRDLGHGFKNLVPVLIDEHRESMSNSRDPPTSDTILDLATADNGCYVIYTSGRVLEHPFTYYSVLPSY